MVGRSSWRMGGTWARCLPTFLMAMAAKASKQASSILVNLDMAACMAREYCCERDTSSKAHLQISELRMG